MKRFTIFILGCLFCSFASAQYNFYRLSVGLNVGATHALADVQKIIPKPSIILSGDYHITPFTLAGIEIQKGNISGGDSIADPHLRYFNNSYLSVILNGKVQLGQFVDFESSNLLYAIRGFYVGTGVGMVQNNMADIVRYKPKSGTPPYKFPGLEKSTNLFIPINTGISFNVVDKWRFTKFIFSFNYQSNIMLGEDIDGYNDPKSIFKNGRDFWGVASVGVKYCFGPEGLY